MRWYLLFFLVWITFIQADIYEPMTLLALRDSHQSLKELRNNLNTFSEETLITKPAIRDMLSTTPSAETHIKLSGPDSQTRPVAVTFQRAFEQSIIKMLHSGKITGATAIIHTDRPATPLCNQSGQVVTDSLPDEIKSDPNRLKTIKDRTQSVRLLAQEKKVDLYITYSNQGLNKRTEKERSTYFKELKNRNNIALHDVELSCPSIPEKLSGATYILKLANGENLIFSLNGSQAQDATNAMNWEYWLDSLNNPVMQKRLDQILNYLKNCGLNISV
ncbi:hypothetical protein EOPP23_04840 [Endozoicomonas sp. OPT23]|uniref:hypothetical protein n=1 Tax=Endozoicomonas sp. OPT23 TaxID=2072845 RepID=UPI00129BE9B0|nr:hypothetical protein [Endozoicomonas sp. OPT23]MRI32321.1 hypothetical protein [Endozoicomonas sp. OPT23]